MSDLPQISEAEFEVMKIVWKHAPISTNEITDKLLQTTSWSPKTIQTLIKLIRCDSGSFLFVAISKSYSCNISIITQVRFQVNMFFLKLTTT